VLAVVAQREANVATREGQADEHVGDAAPLGARSTQEFPASRSIVKQPRDPDRGAAAPRDVMDGVDDPGGGFDTRALAVRWRGLDLEMGNGADCRQCLAPESEAADSNQIF